MWVNGLHRIRWRRVAVSRGHRTRRVSVREILKNIQQSGVEKGEEMWANGFHRIRWRRVAVARGHRTRRVSFRKRFRKYTAK